MMDTTIIQGSDLTDAQIDFMNKQRLMEYGKNSKDFKKNELESLFFFLAEAGSVKAFGMLKPVGITYEGQRYLILGIGNIIAVEKGQGYGKHLMDAIQKYLVSKNMTGLGFCDEAVRGFYVQCGFQMVDDLSSRFRYLYAHADGQKEKLEGSHSNLYLEGADGLLGKLLASDELIPIDVPFW